MLLTNEIAMFLNQLYLSSKWMKQPDILYATYLWKLKIDLKYCE